MGLDQYLFKIRKLSQQELDEIKGWSVERIEGDSWLTVFSKSEMINNDELIKNIKPYLSEIEIPVQKYDWNKIKEDYDLSNTEVTGCVFSRNGVKFMFGNDKEIDLSQKEYDSYIYTAKETSYVVDMTEIYYWRKDFGLAEKLNDIYQSETRQHIMNCGYYPLSNEMRAAVLENIEQNPYNIPYELYQEPNDNWTICYHEWY